MFIRPTLFRSQDTDGSAPEIPSLEAKQTFSIEYVRELRTENKAIRLRAAEFEAALKAAQDEVTKAQKSAEARVAEVQTESEARIVRSELKRIATQAGMHDLDGLKLADLSGVKLNPNGDLEGAEALMTSLKESKPYLFSNLDAGVKTGTTSNPKPAPRAAEPVKKSAMQMTPAEYKAERERVARG